jgi:hypothetical protein
MLDELRKVGPMIKASTLAQVLLVLTLVPNIVIPIITTSSTSLSTRHSLPKKG